MPVSKPIEKVYDKLVDHFKNNPNDINTLLRDLKKIIQDVFSKFINDDKRYCSKFKLPANDVVNIAHDIGLPIDDIRNAFIKQWQLPRNDHQMYGNEFYHVLLLIFLYGVRNNNESLAKTVLTLILFRMWNGRLSNAIKFCDTDTMDYVTMYMGTNRHLFRKFNTPMQLIMEHFVPTMYKKYAPMVKTDTDKLKLLFNQTYNRLHQVFYQGFAPSLKNPGKNFANSGLAVHYYKAKKDGLKLSTVGQHNQNEDEYGFEQKLSSTNISDIVDGITNSIIMNYKPTYDHELINDIAKYQNLNKNAVLKIAHAIHSNQYSEYIHDIISLMLQHLKHTDKEICNEKVFYKSIQNKIISSKHSSYNNQLKHTANLLLEKIIKSVFNKDYSTYSTVRKLQLRNAFIMIFAYNLYNYVCKS